MIESEDTGVRATPGDFHGRPTLRMANRAIVIEMLTAAGPRIVGLRRQDASANLLAETPDLGWETALGRYELLGGHRLWLAPEDSEQAAIPDSDGLAVDLLADGVRLTGAEEPPTGCVRSMEVRLDPVRPSFSILHRVDNLGSHPLELAPWSITQLPLGGEALLPLQRAVDGHETRPNRAFVLWPYSSLDDPRLHIRDGLITVDAVSGEDLKVGCLDDSGWVAYVREGVAIVRRFEPLPGAPHPDLGCNVETYCGSRFIELEVLGPTVVLAPGSSTTLAERWEVRDVPSDDPMRWRDALSRPFDELVTR